MNRPQTYGSVREALTAFLLPVAERIGVPLHVDAGIDLETLSQRTATKANIMMLAFFGFGAARGFESGKSIYHQEWSVFFRGYKGGTHPEQFKDELIAAVNGLVFLLAGEREQMYTVTVTGGRYLGIDYGFDAYEVALRLAA